MFRSWKAGLFLILMILIVGSGCARQTGPGTVLPLSTPTMAGSLPDDGHGATALTAYPIAEAQAKQWNSQAVLYQIPVARLMEKNLGLPSDLLGWFFMFKVPGSPVEYYIKVVQGRVLGVTEAQPIIIGEAPYTYLPIDLVTLPIGNDAAFRLFMEDGGKDYLTLHPRPIFDYRLVHLEGQPNPVWSIFDAANLDQPPLFNVDAVTGQEVGDPFAK